MSNELEKAFRYCFEHAGYTPQNADLVQYIIKPHVAEIKSIGEYQQRQELHKCMQILTEGIRREATA